jgi:hypothetical protein
MVGQDADRDSALHQRSKGRGAITSTHVRKNRPLHPPSHAGARAECGMGIPERGEVLQSVHRDRAKMNI